MPLVGGPLRPSALDFFAGSGLATEALQSHFDVVWANDICEKKQAVYVANHGSEHFQLSDIHALSGTDLPPATLSWASFPCQDLSLAGNQRGLDSERSGLVWQWLRIMDQMPQRPPVLCAENVPGLLSIDSGAQYLLLHNALVERGYRVGAVLLNASHWLPQSRLRVFVVAVQSGINLPAWVMCSGPEWAHPPSVARIAARAKDWVWWSLPLPRKRKPRFKDIVDFKAPCDDESKSRITLSRLPKSHAERLSAELTNGFRATTGYRRTRNGESVLELRFDGLAGCLRTPEGGSSRQVVIIRSRTGEVRTRLITVKEAARLMGAPESYKIPGTYNDGYRAMGDAVVVPVVRHLSEHVLLPLSEACTYEK